MSASFRRRDMGSLRLDAEAGSLCCPVETLKYATALALPKRHITVCVLVLAQLRAMSLLIFMLQ
jgi:hypothetical protein